MSGDDLLGRPATRRDPSRLPRLTDRLPLGTSGLEVSPFCLGMVHVPETVLEAFDAGINFFFVTADMHWPLYASLREGLAQLFARGGGVRDQVVVVGTTYVAQSAFLQAPFIELVDAVPGLERIDVCAIGGCYGADPPVRRERMREHRASRFLGCRAVGASFHDRDIVAEACNTAAVDVAFLRYNARHAGAREDVFPHLRPSTTLRYGFKSMSGFVRPDRLAAIPDLPPGLWVPERVDHYRFALSGPGLDGILCSPTRPEQVRDLALAMERGPLDDDEQEHLIDLALLASGAASLAAADDAPDVPAGPVRA